MVATVEAGRDTSTRTGVCRNCSVMCWISSRHGGREEQRLAREGDELADAFDVGDEAHVEHAVGFVDHQQFDAGQQQAAALVVVEQAAGRGDQDVDAAHQLGVLIVEGDAADDQGDVELLLGTVFDEALFHLGGEFAGRLEDQGAGHARPRATLFQHGEHGQDEGGGLAGPGLGNAEHVAPGEHVGNGLFLNGGRGRITSAGNGGEDFFGQAELGKRHEASKRGTARSILGRAGNTRSTDMRGRAVACVYVRPFARNITRPA